MIKNIVFDMGGVLVDYDTERFLRTHFAPEHRAEVGRKIFLSEEWREADRGTYSAEAALEIMCSHLPESLRDEARRMVLDREKEMPPIEKMYPVVRKLKKKTATKFICFQIAQAGSMISKRVCPHLNFLTASSFRHIAMR